MFEKVLVVMTTLCLIGLFGGTVLMSWGTNQGIISFIKIGTSINLSLLLPFLFIGGLLMVIKGDYKTEQTC